MENIFQKNPGGPGKANHGTLNMMLGLELIA
jgi:hypothetical protein